MVEQSCLAHSNPETERGEGSRVGQGPQGSLVVYILQVGSIFLQLQRALRKGLETKSSLREPVRDISLQPVIAFFSTVQPEDPQPCSSEHGSSVISLDSSEQSTP